MTYDAPALRRARSFFPPSMLSFPPRTPSRRPETGRRARIAAIVAGGLVAGGVVAGALLGMLLGFGRREGTLWRPLNAAAHTVLGGHADGVWGYQSNVTFVGGGVVLVVSLAAGLLVASLLGASLSSPHRFFHSLVAAGGVSLTGYLVHLHIVARTPGGLAALLTLGELRALYLALAIALLAGIRFAFSDPARTRAP